jgi:hypothetical protein
VPVSGKSGLPISYREFASGIVPGFLFLYSLIPAGIAGLFRPHYAWHCPFDGNFEHHSIQKTG